MLMPFSTYSDSDTHSRQCFYEHTPFTLLGLWYSALGHPHMQILYLFNSASNCPHGAGPPPSMDALLTLLGLWLLAQIYLLLVDFLFSGLRPYSACLASLLFNILRTKLTLMASCSSMWLPLNPTLALTARDIPSMNILFSLLRSDISYYTSPLPALVDLITSPFMSSDFPY